MRVLHVVTLVSDDGAFGGPLTVAMNQCQALAARGHEVTIAAGWQGSEDPPRELRGTPARLFGVRRALPTGFSGLTSPALWSWLKRSAGAFDVVHVHHGRDLITLGSLHVLRDRPYVSQTHGMVGVDGRLVARALDAVATRRLLRSARRLLVLTDAEERDLPSVARTGLPLTRIGNGVPLPDFLPVTRAAGRPQVLFCARLQPRKRPEAFVRMAGRLVEQGVAADFRLVGPDEGSLLDVQRLLEELDLAPHVRYEGALPYDAVLARMRQADVYVLPSVDEPFPMSLLEAMSLGLPCVISDSCGIAEVLRARRAAVITDGSPEELAAAVGRLVLDVDERRALGERARTAVRELYSLDAMADVLEEVYDAVARDVTS